MTMTLGRAGRDIALPDPTAFKLAGDKLTLRGSILDLGYNDLWALRDQLLAYNGNVDEPQVVLRAGSMTGLDGYYTVDSVDLDEDADVADTLATNWAAQLTRVGGFQGPLIEAYCTWSTIPNVNNVTGNYAVHGVPGTVYQHADYPIGQTNPGSDDHGFNRGIWFTRNSVDGALTMFERDVPVGNTIALWAAPLEDFYMGQCKIEVDIGSGTWRTVVGRQVPNNALAVRLSNGLVRISFQASGGLLVEHARKNGTGWYSANQYSFETTSGFNVQSWEQVSVLRNAVEGAALRLIPGPFGGPINDLPVIDVGVVRGYRWCFGRLAMMKPGIPNVSLPTWRVIHTVTVASTALSGNRPGVVRTNIDGSGNRFIVVADYPQWPIATTETNQGGVRISPSRQSFSFGLGMSLEGSVDTNYSTDPDCPTRQVDEWIAGYNEAMRVVRQ